MPVSRLSDMHTYIPVPPRKNPVFQTLPNWVLKAVIWVLNDNYMGTQYT
jgi:hypothetical protein